MAHRFTKLTHFIPLKRTTGLKISKAFASHYFFNYGASNEFLSDNGPQFTSKLYQNTYRILGNSNTFNSVYHPQTNINVVRFNWLIATMLHCYVSYHPENFNEYPEPLTRE